MNYLDELFENIEGHKIVIYGADVTGLAFVVEAKRRGVEISYAVDGNQTKWGTKMYGIAVKSPYDLLYEIQDELKIVITAPTGRNSILTMLKDMQIDDQCIECAYIDNKDKCSHIDILMGISRGKDTIVDMNVKDLRAEDTYKRILILGGSTSDPTYNGIKSWPLYLQELADERDYGVQVFSAGVIGYSSSQELLCLLRDGLMINPDIVISYTGYNDYSPGSDINGKYRIPLVGRNLYDLSKQMIDGYKEKEILPPMYYGEETGNHFSVFLNNARCIHGICQEYGIEYFSIYQPMLKHQEVSKGSFEDKILQEDLVKQCLERETAFHYDFVEALNNYDWMYDFSHIFEDETDVFLDMCHTNEKGNELIARSVLDLLEKENRLGE